MLTYDYTSFYASSPSLTADIQPTTILFDGGPSSGGSFASVSYGYDYATWTGCNDTHASATFNLQSLTISTVSAVPLPASAPMFGAAPLGLGAVGIGIRRRKATAAA